MVWRRNFKEKKDNSELYTLDEIRIDLKKLKNDINRWKTKENLNNKKLKEKTVVSIDKDLKNKFDELNINRSSLWHIVEKKFSNSNAHWTYTKFEFDESLEKKDNDGYTYIEINWTKFYKLEYIKENWKTTWIKYKDKIISNEELNNSTEIMYTYSNLKWESYNWEKMGTVEISLMRWTSISWIQFTGTSVYKTDWNRSNGTAGRWKPIRQNKTTIL